MFAHTLDRVRFGAVRDFLTTSWLIIDVADHRGRGRAAPSHGRVRPPGVGIARVVAADRVRVAGVTRGGQRRVSRRADRVAERDRADRPHEMHVGAVGDERRVERLRDDMRRAAAAQRDERAGCNGVLGVDHRPVNFGAFRKEVVTNAECRPVGNLDLEDVHVGLAGLARKHEEGLRLAGLTAPASAHNEEGHCGQTAERDDGDDEQASARRRAARGRRHADRCPPGS